jgi:hypothetical protein
MSFIMERHENSDAGSKKSSAQSPQKTETSKATPGSVTPSAVPDKTAKVPKFDANLRWIKRNDLK